MKTTTYIKKNNGKNPENKTIGFSVIIPAISRDEAKEVIASIKNTREKNIEIIIETGNNPSRQRNRGVEKAKKDIIVFLDSDVVVNKDYFNRLKDSLRNGADAVGGPNLTYEKDANITQLCVGECLSTFFGVGPMKSRYLPNKDFRISDEKEIILCNLAFKKKIVKRFLFNTSLFPNEENELINRISAEGIQVYHDPRLIVYHKRKKDMIKTIKQFFSYGEGRQLHMTKYKYHKKKDYIFLIPSLFFIYFVFSILSLPVLFYYNTLHILMLPLLVYFCIGLTYSAITSFKKKSIKYLLCSIYFPVIHLSYGAGYISPIITKKKIFWKEN